MNREQKTDYAELGLDHIAAAKRWVAWREEKVKAKDGTERPSKIPYDPNRPGAKARIPTDVTTYGTRKEAERCWKRMRAGDVVGGVGIVLGDLDDGSLLMGIDLDGCVEADNAEPWAIEIIERFSSYSEISSSGHGIKIFFRIAEEDVSTVKRLLGSDPKIGKLKTRKAFVAGEHEENGRGRIMCSGATCAPPSPRWGRPR